MYYSLRMWLTKVSADARGKVDGYTKAFGQSSTWKNIAAAGEESRNFADGVFHRATQHFGALDRETLTESLQQHFEGIRSGVAEMVTPVQETAMVARLLAKLHDSFDRIVRELQEAFPPPSQAPGHAQRQRTVSAMIDRTQEAVLNVARKSGVSEQYLEKATSSMEAAKPLIEALVVVPGEESGRWH